MALAWHGECIVLLALRGTNQEADMGIIFVAALVASGLCGVSLTIYLLCQHIETMWLSDDE